MSMIVLNRLKIEKKKEENEKRGKFVKFAVEGLTRTEEARKDRRIKVIMTGCEREIEIGREEVWTRAKSRNKKRNGVER